MPESLVGKKIRPKYIATNRFNDLYVVDDENYWLVFIPGDGGEPQVAGGWGDSGELFVLPSDIVAWPGLDIFLCDNATHRILRFDRKLNFIADLNLSEMTPRAVEFPYRIAKNHLGEMIVASLGNWEVSLISTEGTFITRMGDATYGNNRFAEITDLALGENNEVGLVDIGSGTFYVLTRTGNVKRKIPLPGSGRYLVKWWRHRWLMMGETGIIYEASSGDDSFREVLQDLSARQEFLVNDFSMVDDVIYVVDDQSGKIFTAELRVAEN